MNQQLIIIGIGDTARNIWNVVVKDNLFDIIGFAVDKEYKNTNEFCGLPLFTIDEMNEKFNKDQIRLFVAIQWNKLNGDRRRVYEKLKKNGYRFVTIISPNAIIHNECKIGENCWIADNVVIEATTVIGDNTFVKVGALVAHYVKIEKHCFIGAHSLVAGHSMVGEQSFVGIKATIYDNVRIGEKSLIGANSVIKQNIPPYSVVRNKSELLINKSDDVNIESKLLYSFKKENP